MDMRALSLPRDVVPCRPRAPSASGQRRDSQVSRPHTGTLREAFSCPTLSTTTWMALNHAKLEY
jgi:hypothetical protein